MLKRPGEDLGIGIGIAALILVGAIPGFLFLGSKGDSSDSSADASGNPASRKSDSIASEAPVQVPVRALGLGENE